MNHQHFFSRRFHRLHGLGLPLFFHKGFRLVDTRRISQIGALRALRDLGFNQNFKRSLLSKGRVGWERDIVGKGLTGAEGSLWETAAVKLLPEGRNFQSKQRTKKRCVVLPGSGLSILIKYADAAASKNAVNVVMCRNKKKKTLNET